MSSTAVIFSLFGAFTIVILILTLVIRKYLTPGQSVLWLILSLFLLLFSIFPNLFFKLSTFVGAQSAISTMTFLALLFFAGYSLYLSSRVALLERRIERLSIYWAIHNDAVDVNTLTSRGLPSD